MPSAFDRDRSYDDNGPYLTIDYLCNGVEKMRNGSDGDTEGSMLRSMGLFKILREDYHTHRRDWTWPGLQALWVHRIGVYGATFSRPWRSFFAIFHGIGHVFCRNVYGIEIARSVNFGRRMHIGHQHGIVVHKYARFGDDCMLRQGVTLGVGSGWERGVGPVIGNNVEFGVGCVILGNIKIGNNVQIGPNCVVMNDVPSDRSLFIAPARVMPRTIANTPEEPSKKTAKFED